jgi:hypothetical protein
MGYDTRPLVTLAEKEAVLRRAADENWVLLLEHDPPTRPAPCSTPTGACAWPKPCVWPIYRRKLVWSAAFLRIGRETSPPAPVRLRREAPGEGA